MCISNLFISGKISRGDISGKFILTRRLAIPVLNRQNTPTQRSYTALLRFELVALGQKRKSQRPGSNARDKSSIQMCRDGRF
ncbi:putative transcriptional regulatory protein [Fusarium oxysporum f. sp. albedinis]|nr:putative transcriptional regulatory protein [Fusarium oxysporum f. sp. albedinis]